MAYAIHSDYLLIAAPILIDYSLFYKCYFHPPAISRLGFLHRIYSVRFKTGYEFNKEFAKICFYSLMLNYRFHCEVLSSFVFLLETWNHQVQFTTEILFQERVKHGIDQGSGKSQKVKN